MKSLLTDNDGKCYICGSSQWLETHHIFFGPKRNVSEKNGFKVPLCRKCHTGTGDGQHPPGVHFNIALDKKLKAICQKEYERTHSHDEFMNRIGRNYL